MSQLPLNLPVRAALGRQDFMSDASNAAALALVDAWPDWPHHGAILVGPPGSGKSHLASIWSQRSDARALASVLEGNAWLAEDCHAGIDERALFHALNQARQLGGHVLMTAQSYPAHWKIALPDLASRLKASPVTGIGAPGDGLLRSVLVKLFADRQIAVDEPTVSFMLLRMPRSLGAARELVADIDQQAMAERADVTRAFVARVMSRRAEPGFFDGGE